MYFNFKVDIYLNEHKRLQTKKVSNLKPQVKILISHKNLLTLFPTILFANESMLIFEISHSFLFLDEKIYDRVQGLVRLFFVVELKKIFYYNGD